MIEITISVNRVPIRLTDERWTHIVENHDDLAGRREDVLETVEEPDWVTKRLWEFFDCVERYGRKRYLAVVYKELRLNDGFIITANITSKANKRNKLWP